ncbi:hypothetical protein EDC96DRAFT_562509 [Choanephora cucurbitarum]|nr:hypothetical protein EDC96DRAFT_562509 [Choanephora cucurbitarum]
MPSETIPSEYLNCFNLNEDLWELKSFSRTCTVLLLWSGATGNLDKTSSLNQNSFSQACNQAPKQLAKEKAIALIKTEKAAKAGKVRGSYRSPQQIQELLDLVIEQDLLARQAGLFVDIEARTAHHYVKLCDFGRFKRGKPAKAELLNNRGITVTIVGAICEKGIIDLASRKPKTVQRKVASN